MPKLGIYLDNKFWNEKMTIADRIIFCNKRLRFLTEFSGVSLFAKVFAAGQVNTLIYEIQFLEGLLEKY